MKSQLISYVACIAAVGCFVAATFAQPRPSTVPAARPSSAIVGRNGKSPEATVSDEFNSGDPQSIQDGLVLLDRIVADAPRKVRRDIQARWLKPMLRAKVYDQVEKIAVPGILSGPEDTAGISGVQNARVQAFMEAEKFPQALEAAKVYYNVCQLEETETAVNFLIDALASTRGRDDHDIVRRFKLQQTAGAQPSLDPATQASDLGENILKTISVDASPYEAAIESLASQRQSFTTLTGRGNLLLLADRPAEARQAFEQAVDLATTSQLSAALANVARALRAESGSIGQANAYILALRKQ